MKLEKKFESKNNKLYFLNGQEFLMSKSEPLDASLLNESSPVPEDASVYYKLNLAWSKVGMDEESYNESMLASLRDWLKICEEKNVFVFINPVADVEVSTSVAKENLTASFKHCARRIKDCVSVIGFAIPSEVDSDFYVEELSAKHGHYVFFGKGNVLQNDSIVCEI